MKYEITKEQILILKNGYRTEKLLEWFPEAFKTVLEVGCWYFIERCDSLFDDKQKALVFYEDKDDLYGFDHGGKWINCYANPKNDKYIFTKATESEVFEALKNEAVKRGFVEGVYLSKVGINEKWSMNFKAINGEFDFDLKKNILDSGNGYGYIFNKGQWAEIIPTITKKEAEKLLNKKII